jgi:hypothetical protein
MHRASLKLRSLGGERQGSLLAAIDRTVTGPGARGLARGWRALRDRDNRRAARCRQRRE